MHLRIVKLGGSLLDLPGVADRLRLWLAGEPPAATLLIVGGGQLADAIRRAQQVHGWDDAASHRLCLDIMGVTAALACELLPEASLVRRPDEIDRTAPGLPIIDVRAFLIAADPLPESWQVTSDSIAAHLAVLLEADELVLLKSTLPESELPSINASPRALAARGIVDEYFPHAVKPFLDAADCHAGGRDRVRLVNLRHSRFAELAVVDSPVR
jgi:5-(aminomethyl)-3-furanmethanol phosphate kinase